MTKVSPFVITISRQLGSGGAYLGQRLATRLNILYLDREIVCEAAKKLKVSEDTVASCDEKLTPPWQRLFSSYSIGIYSPPVLDMVTDETIHETESEVIKRAAQETNVIVIGRGGFYVLRQHPHHLSIFLYADIAFRQQRVQKLYNLSEQQSLKLIESTDKGRARYLLVLTGHDWNDARQYQLCLDTNVLGFDKAEEIIMDTVRARFGNLISV
jgi:cytidylate kinase